MSSIGSELLLGFDLDPKTANALGRFARRRQRLLLVRGFAAAFIIFAVSMLFIAICDYLWLMSDPIRWCLSAIAYLMTASALWWFGLRPMGDRDARKIARQLESADPRLREDLLSAVELSDPRDANGSDGFRRWLQRNVAQRAGGVEVRQLLPVGLIQRWLIGGLVLALTLLALFLVPRMQFGRRIARAMLPGAPIQRASLTYLSILKPSPPSGFVAEGDAVAVIVQMGGRAADEIFLQWRNKDGIAGETIMTPRVNMPLAIGGDTIDTESLFAANLSVGSIPVEYRVVGGDGITLWHQLTPLPRPRVTAFRKNYEFPSYSELPSREEDSEHGDLKALLGTSARVTFSFDEPVEDATIRYGNRGAAIRLDPVEGDARAFVTRIPIRTPGTYQVDAVSQRSGLSNPFSPQYSITPIVDHPPFASWNEDQPRFVIVSPLDVIPLAAVVSDDLPLSRVVQEFQVNGGPVQVRQLDVTEPDRDLQLNWEWDLLRRLAEVQETKKLESGDLVRMRVVAIDRNSQRGESSFVELLIAEEGFDSERHARMEELGKLTDGVADWASRAKRWFDDVREIAEQEDSDRLDDVTESALRLAEDSQTLLADIRQFLPTCTTLPDANALELLGRGLADLSQEQTQLLASLRATVQDQHPSWRKAREKLIREAARAARDRSNDAARLEQYAEHLFGEELTLALVSDSMALQRSIQPMLGEETRLPLSRFPRYLMVTVGRLQAIDQLIQKHAESIPDSTNRHLQSWDRWSSAWSARLKAAIEQPPKEQAFRALIAQFNNELKNQVDHAMIDGRLTSMLGNLLRELRIQIGPTSDLVRRMAKHGQSSQKTDRALKSETDSDSVAGLQREKKEADLGFQLSLDQLVARIEQEESLHRSRPRVDLQFAADMKLMRRAMENVASSGYADYRDEPAPSVYQNLAMAYQIIEAKHEADQWNDELQQLMLAERRLNGSAVNKVKHPDWIERYAAGLEWPTRTLQNAAIDWKELEAIDQTRYNEPLNQARSRITMRRWSGEPMLSAEAPLHMLQQQLAEELKDLQPKVVEARATIAKYVLTLSEQAREAAKLAEEAQQRSESRPDATQETSAELDEQQAPAEEATRRTLESLVDLANTSSLTDEAARELARDADVAASQIQQSVERAQEAMENAQRAESDQQRSDALDENTEALDELAKQLNQTAEHFQRAEDGEDITSSREQLRQGEAQADLNGEFEERYDRAKEMADAAQSSPEEMMRQLEEELDDNAPMRQELSEIAQRAAREAQQTLEQAARDEESVSQSMERSDASFQEQKRRAAQQIESLARRANAVEQSLLNATGRAIGWGNTPDAQPKLDEARKSLREATVQANQMGGENAVLTDMKKTANDMADAIAKATSSLEELREETSPAQDKDIHRDESSRQRTQDQVDRFARDARSQQLRASSTEKQQWSNLKQAAGRRVQTAQRQRRDAENQQRRLKQRISREPKNTESIRREIEKNDVRISNANKAEEAATQSREFAEQQYKSVQKQEQEIKKKKIAPHDKPNPAAQLATRASEEADQALDEIGDALRKVAENLDFANDLRTPASQSEQLEKLQRNIQGEINEAEQKLRRAARHEERLGQDDLSNQLDAAADIVQQQATDAAQQAAESLQRASSDAAQAPQANQRVADAAQSIQEAADQLAQMLGTELAQGDPSQQGQQQADSPSQQQGEELARTLDELDRQMASSQQSSQQSSDPSQGQPGEKGEQGEQGQQNQSMTAQDASPTLANAMDAQAQQAARQRQQQLNPSQAQSQGNQPGESTNQSASKSGARQPGSGEMPDGGMVDTDGIDRLGSDWGQLREQRTDNVAESRGATIAPQYRREIEAYFQAIARRAAEKKE